MHWVSETYPKPFPHLPCEQRVHWPACPRLLEYFPCAQFLHSLAARPVSSLYLNMAIPEGWQGKKKGFQ